MKTTYSDVIKHFVRRSETAHRYLKRWLFDAHKVEVVPFVQAAETKLPYLISPEDVEEVCKKTEHALGQIKRSDAESAEQIVDWHPSFAFEHVLHHAAESLGHIPTYQGLRRFCATDGTARRMLWEPALEAIRTAETSGFPAATARAAVRWRVGNAYLSYLREMYVIAVLRAAGVDARYHILADVLLRVDCWVANRCLTVYVGNPKFRHGSKGRKPPAHAVLGDGPFQFAELALPRRHEFGTVHLPDANDVIAAFHAVG